MAPKCFSSSRCLEIEIFFYCLIFILFSLVTDVSTASNKVFVFPTAFLVFDRNSMLILSSICTNLSVPAMTLSKTSKLSMAESYFISHCSGNHGSTRDCIILGAQIYCSNYAKYSRGPEFSIPWTGSTTFSFLSGSKFRFFGGRMYTSRFSGVPDWIYAWVVSLLWVLASSMNAASKRITHYVKRWTVDAFVVSVAACLSPWYWAANRHLYQ